jgi:hypothetical protein
MYNSYNSGPESAQEPIAPMCWSDEFKYQEVALDESESFSGKFQELLDSPVLKYLRKERSVVNAAPTVGILDMIASVTRDVSEADRRALPPNLAESID